MTTASQSDNAYDLFPYESWAFAQSYPGRLATIARLFGMQPKLPRFCRVLELGAASGGNLIPMALMLPESEFIGIDFSVRQIENGQGLIRRLNLNNISLRHASILDVDASFGHFDYIICHGVFLWVPAAVQEKIFAICRDNLAPDGIAYVSYNTLPGWRMRGMLRDMMSYHGRQFIGPLQQVQQARALLDFLGRSIPADNAYGLLLKSEFELLGKQSDSYLFHEHLEEHNEPLYFHQFIERASGYGLQYLGESSLSAMLGNGLSSEVIQTLQRVAPDLIRMEQYLDFVRNRTFRQTLLVHAEQPLRRVLNQYDLRGLYMAGDARADVDADIAGTTLVTFRGPNKAGLTTGNPITKAAMCVLAERWPLTLAFSDLCRAARIRLEPLRIPDAAQYEQDAQVLSSELLQCYTVDLVELSVEPCRFVRHSGEYPVASSYARMQAENSARLTNLRLEQVNVDEFLRQLLLLLDGSRNRTQLIDGLVGLVSSGVLVLQQDGRHINDAEMVRDLLVKTLDSALKTLGMLALLTE